MIRHLIYDFGAVLVDWVPRRLYVPYFGDEARADWVLTEICPYEWNAQVDAGRSPKEVTEERVALFPEWEKEIRLYFDRWIDMMGDGIPGMEALVRDYKARGYGAWGLTNWSWETFPLIRDRYPVFGLLDGFVVSGKEKTVKPGPRIYRILLERYGLRAEECIFIDDNPKNTAGAEAVGIRGLVFQDAAQLRRDLDRILSE